MSKRKRDESAQGVTGALGAGFFDGSGSRSSAGGSGFKRHKGDGLGLPAGARDEAQPMEDEDMEDDAGGADEDVDEGSTGMSRKEKQRNRGLCYTYMSTEMTTAGAQSESAARINRAATRQHRRRRSW